MYSFCRNVVSLVVHFTNTRAYRAAPSHFFWQILFHKYCMGMPFERKYLLVTLFVQLGYYSEPSQTSHSHYHDDNLAVLEAVSAW